MAKKPQFRHVVACDSTERHDKHRVYGRGEFVPLGHPQCRARDRCDTMTPAQARMAAKKLAKSTGQSVSTFKLVFVGRVTP